MSFFNGEFYSCNFLISKANNEKDKKVIVASGATTEGQFAHRNCPPSNP